MSGSRLLRHIVLGVGYLGASHAACLAELGFEVLGVDNDARRIEELAAGGLPFFEPGLEGLLRRHLGSGRLRFTISYHGAAGWLYRAPGRPGGERSRHPILVHTRELTESS